MMNLKVTRVEEKEGMCYVWVERGGGMTFPLQNHTYVSTRIRSGDTMHIHLEEGNDIFFVEIVRNGALVLKEPFSKHETLWDFRAEEFVKI